MSSVPILTYYGVRGLAQPIRLLLKYCGIDFIDKKYEFGPGNSLADIKSIQQEWLLDKYNLGLDFPNIPNYIDGDFKLTQSLTILRYLGRKHGLVATDELSLVRQDLVEQQILDLRMDFGMKIVLNPTYDNEKEQLTEEVIVPHLQLLAKFLGSNEWLVKELTFVDFLVYEILDWIRLFTPKTFEKFPTLEQYLTRFKSLPPIKKYMTSSDFISWPLFGPVAKWGWQKSK